MINLPSWGAAMVTISWRFAGRRALRRSRDPSGAGEAAEPVCRDQFNALGKRNIAAMSGSLTRNTSAAPHPTASTLMSRCCFSDVTESGEFLDLSELVREALPPAFRRLT